MSLCLISPSAPSQPSLDGAGAALCVALRPARLPWRRAFVWPRRGRSARELPAPPPPGEKEGGEDRGGEGGTRLRGRGWEGGAAGVPSVPRVSLGSEPLKHTTLLVDSRSVAIRAPCLLQSGLPFPPTPAPPTAPSSVEFAQAGHHPGSAPGRTEWRTRPGTCGWLRLGQIEASSVLFEMGRTQGTAPLDWQQAGHALIPFPRVRAAEPGFFLPNPSRLLSLLMECSHSWNSASLSSFPGSLAQHI